MKCPLETGQGPEILVAYCSGEMETEAAAAFAHHLTACSACRAQVAAQRAVWQALEEWEAPRISADFDRRLYHRIENEISWWHRLMRPLWLRRGLPAAAAAAAALAAILVFRPAWTPPSAGSPDPVVEAVAPDQAEQTLQDMEALREFSRLLRSEAAEPKM
jgi:anti-sigma factor RsiW